MTMHKHTPKSILLTGGCGYIAAHTAVVLQEAGYGVILVDNLSNSRREVVDAIAQIDVYKRQRLSLPRATSQLSVLEANCLRSTRPTTPTDTKVFPLVLSAIRR